MQNEVYSILKVFDELDAYEIAELTDELASRGYELRLNVELEKEYQKTVKMFGLYIVSYKDEAKISIIKFIRHFSSEFETDEVQSCIYPEDLPQAKKFIDEKEYENTPIATGKKDVMKNIKALVEKEFGERIEMKIKELSGLI